VNTTLSTTFKGESISLAETGTLASGRLRQCTLADNTVLQCRIEHEYKTRTRRLFKTAAIRPLSGGLTEEPSAHTVLTVAPKPVFGSTLNIDVLDFHIALLTQLKNAILNGEY
jgi:hypothetical protein